MNKECYQQIKVKITLSLIFFHWQHAFQHKVSYNFCDPPPKPIIFLGTLYYSGVTMSNIQHQNLLTNQKGIDVKVSKNFTIDKTDGVSETMNIRD